MKKLLAIILISLMLLSSCAEAGSNSSGETTEPETTAPDAVEDQIEMKVAEFKLLTDKPPLIDTEYQKENKAAEPLPYLVIGKNNLAENVVFEEIKRISERTFDIPVTGESRGHVVNGEKVSYELSFSYKNSSIITDEAAFKEFFAKYTEEKYEDHFAEDLFEKNFVIFIHTNDAEAPFPHFEYGFDEKTSTLKLFLTDRSHEGWHANTSTAGGTNCNFIIIPKEAISVSGEPVAYDQLKVEMTAILNMDKIGT